MMKKWEYAIEYCDLDKRYLADMGDRGWELVAINPIKDTEDDYQFVWKREKVVPEPPKNKAGLDRLAKKLAGKKKPDINCSEQLYAS